MSTDCRDRLLFTCTNRLHTEFRHSPIPWLQTYSFGSSPESSPVQSPGFAATPLQNTVLHPILTSNTYRVLLLKKTIYTFTFSDHMYIGNNRCAYRCSSYHSLNLKISPGTLPVMLIVIVPKTRDHYMKSGTYQTAKGRGRACS